MSSRPQTGSRPSTSKYSLTRPTQNSPSHFRQLNPQNDLLTDLVKNLNLLKQQLNTAKKNVEGHKEVMSERIEIFENDIIKNQEMCETLRNRIKQFSTDGVSYNQEKSMQSYAEEQTSETVGDFLEEHPLILYLFLNKQSKYPESIFTEFYRSLKDDAKSSFIQYSSYQLTRYSLCYTIFSNVIQKVHEKSFFEELNNSVKKVFNSETSMLFLKSKKTGFLSCFFDSGDMEISFTDKKNMIYDAMDSNECKVYTDPSSSPFFSESFDTLFNPNNLPLILIPVSKEAVIYILQTNPLKFGFTKEDCAIGNFLAFLISPLIFYHFNHEKIDKEYQKRKSLSTFENSIMKISHFADLIPFLNKSLSENLKANKVKLFLINPAKNKTYNYYVKENKFKKNIIQLLQRKSELCGSIQQVAQKKIYLTEEILTTHATYYDSRVDEWAINQTFMAFPIYGQNEDVESVICISRTKDNNKISEWDLEFLRVASNVLSIIIPTCIHNKDKLEDEQAEINIQQFPHSITSLNLSQFKQSDYLYVIASKIVDVIQCEYISIFSNGRHLISLHDHDDFHKPILSVSYMSTLAEAFQKSTDSKENDIKAITYSDVNRVPEFEADNEIEPTSFIAVEHHAITVYAINAITKLGYFPKGDISILGAFIATIEIAQNANKLSSDIDNNSLSVKNLNNILDICIRSIDQEIPLQYFVKEVAEFLQFHNYLLIKYIKTNHTFTVVLSSNSQISDININENDPIISKATQKNSHMIIKKDENNSELWTLFPENDNDDTIALSTIEKNEFYLFLIGDESATHFIPENELTILLSKLSSLIYIFFENYMLMEKPQYITVSEMNKFNLSDLGSIPSFDSFSFNPKLMNESQQVECVMKVFLDEKIGNLIDFLGIDIYGLYGLVEEIKRHYYNETPYHNFTHIVDVVQFVYLCLKQMDLDDFDKIEITAIILAALCHDIEHRGIDSLTLHRSNAALSFSFGILSSLEKNHAFIASEILKKYSFSKIIDNPQFWSFFMEIIVATDIRNSLDILRTFNNPSFKSNIDMHNSEHRLVLSQIIVICGNIANCIRPFSFASSMANLLEEERKMQIEYENNHSIPNSKDLPPSNNTSEIPLPEREIQFIQTTAKPLFTALCEIIPNLDKIGSIENLLDETMNHWKS